MPKRVRKKVKKESGDYYSYGRGGGYMEEYEPKEKKKYPKRKYPKSIDELRYMASVRFADEGDLTASGET